MPHVLSDEAETPNWPGRDSDAAALKIGGYRKPPIERLSTSVWCEMSKKYVYALLRAYIASSQRWRYEGEVDTNSTRVDGDPENSGDAHFQLSSESGNLEGSPSANSRRIH